MTFDTHDPQYWDAADLQSEFTRVLDVCHGCRLCDGLCPPFVDVFDRIEQEDDRLSAQGAAARMTDHAGGALHAENPVHHLTKADYDHVVDYCYQCKLCYPK
jgi:Fe-S oxidoreductase